VPPGICSTTQRRRSEVHSLALAVTGTPEVEGLVLPATGSAAGAVQAISRRRRGRRRWTVDRPTVDGGQWAESRRRRFIGGRGWSQGRAAMGAGKSAPLRGIPVL